MTNTQQPMVEDHPTVRRSDGREPTCGSYGGRNKAGAPCRKLAIGGTRRCDMHSGKRRSEAKAAGAVVLELRRWGLDGQTELADPNLVMLKLVTQSAHRVDLLSSKLAEAYEAGERLKAAHEALQLVAAPAGDDELERAAVVQARSDLARIFNTGGVSAFVGLTYSATRDGDLFATGEAIRGLARAEAEERERCATFAARAIAAGLGDRMVRLAEKQGELLVGMISAVLDDLHLSPEQELLVASVVPRHLRALSGPAVIEGTVK